MYLVESGTPLYATQHNSFKTMLHEFGIELSSRQTMESTVLSAIFLAVYRDLQTHLKTVWGSPTASHLQTLVQYGLQHNLQKDALVAACVTDNESAYRLAAHMIADTVACGYHTLELCEEDIYAFQYTTTDILLFCEPDRSA